MSEPSIEPFSVQQRWQLPAPQPGTAWDKLLSDYVAALAGACARYDAGPGPAPVIGHIKLLALFPKQDYLRISAVSAVHPVTCTGGVPDGLAELSLTLNILVYGLPRSAAQELARATAANLVADYAGRVTEEEEQDTRHGSTHRVAGNHSHHDHAR